VPRVLRESDAKGGMEGRCCLMRAGSPHNGRLASMGRQKRARCEEKSEGVGIKELSTGVRIRAGAPGSRRRAAETAIEKRRSWERHTTTPHDKTSAEGIRLKTPKEKSKGPSTCDEGRFKRFLEGGGEYGKESRRREWRTRVSEGKSTSGKRTGGGLQKVRTS